MSEITLNPIRLYNDDDPYEVNADNRPLVDIRSNINTLNRRLGDLGFYLETKANPETEPVGGFSVNTCACIKENRLLYPVDITKPAAEVDYKNYPLVLVVDYDSATNLYKCLTFSILHKLDEKFKSFLVSSVGNPVKVGLGGKLVDSFYFDQYYSGKNYQDVVVGKIASASEIIFGGNQVATLGDNSTLAKNRDDSTTGLIAVVRDNKESNVVFRSLNVNTVDSPYVFAEMQNAYRSSFSTTSLPVPVFFTNSIIDYNQATGDILDLDLESKLNEVHFKSPRISTTNSSDVIYNTLGVTVKSLLEFSTANLLHSKPFSAALGEVGQEVSTLLTFSYTKEDQLALGCNFPAVAKSIGTQLNQTTGVSNSLLPTETDKLPGLTFGNYSQIGAYIGLVSDNSTGVTRPSEADEDALAESTKFKTIKLSDLKDSSTFVIHAKSDDSDKKSNISLYADGYVVLAGNGGGVHVFRQPTLDSEVANKKYVDIKLAAVTDSSIKKIPLTGSTDEEPIKGSLVFDVADHIEFPNRVLKFSCLTAAEIHSNCPVKLVDSSTTQSSTTLQTLELHTNSALATTEAGWNDYEAVNKSYLKAYVTNLLSGSASTNPYVTTGGNDTQTISGKKKFTKALTVSDASGVSLVLDSQLPVISSLGHTVEFRNVDPSKPVKVRTASTSDDDAATTVVTKDYVDSKVGGVDSKIPTIWATWVTKDWSIGGIGANAAPDKASDSFVEYVATATQGTGNVYTILNDCLLRVNLAGLLQGSDYTVAITLKKNNEVIATTGAGSTTTALGRVQGMWDFSLDTLIPCNKDDILAFEMVRTPMKSSATISSLTTRGYIMVMR